MADVSDVENSIVSLIAATVYPNGTGQPSAIDGVPARIYRGWPNASKENQDLKAGFINITVYPEQGGRNTTRYPRTWQPLVFTPPTLTVTTSEPSVTFGGTGGINQVAGIRTDVGAWAYAVQANDTPSTVAAALQALVPGSTVNGAVVTTSQSAGVLGRVVAVGSALQEVRRQVQSFRICFWCPNTATRDLAASLVDAALGAVSFIPLADGTGGRLIYRWSFTNDVPTKERLWRRDIRYDVEYGTTLTQNFTQMLFGGGVLDGNDALTTFGDIQPPDGNVMTDPSGNVWVDALGNLLGEKPS